MTTRGSSAIGTLLILRGARGGSARGGSARGGCGGSGGTRIAVFIANPSEIMRQKRVVIRIRSATMVGVSGIVVIAIEATHAAIAVEVTVATIMTPCTLNGSSAAVAVIMSEWTIGVGGVTEARG